MNSLWPWLMLVVGLLVGWFLAWLFGRSGHRAQVEQIDRLHGETRQLSGELEGCRSRSAAQEKEFQAKTGQLQADMDKALAATARLQAELDASKAAASAAQAKADAASAEAARLQGELEAANRLVAGLRAEFESCKEASTALQHDLEAARAAHAGVQAELETSRAATAQLSADLEAASVRSTAAHGGSGAVAVEGESVGESAAATRATAALEVGAAEVDATATAGTDTNESTRAGEPAGADEAEEVVDAAATESEPLAEETRPAPAAEEPVAVRHDDLTIIKGIGPVFARRLNQAGITTFADLAAADPAALSRIVEQKEWQKIDPDAWTREAKALAERTAKR